MTNKIIDYVVRVYKFTTNTALYVVPCISLTCGCKFDSGVTTTEYCMQSSIFDSGVTTTEYCMHSSIFVTNRDILELFESKA